MNFLKITKREDLPKNKTIFIRILSVLLSLVFAGLVIAALGYNPIEVFTNDRRRPWQRYQTAPDSIKGCSLNYHFFGNSGRL